MAAFRELEKFYEVELPADILGMSGIQDILGEASPGEWCEFCEPVETGALMEPGWGAAMPPDFLPLLGNGAGDYLAARFDWNGSVKDFVVWQHSEARWPVAGATLAESLLLDHIRTQHLSESAQVSLQSWPLLDWFRKHSDGELSRTTWSSTDDLLSFLIANRVGQETIRRWQCERELAKCDYEPGSRLSGDDVRHWERANRLATEVLRFRQDLAWAYCVTGAYNEVRGQPSSAIEQYEMGLQLSSISEDLPLWDRPRSPKFCADRLALLDASRSDPYLTAVCFPKEDAPPEARG